MIVVSLDGKPLATSAKVLVQAFVEEKTYGFRVGANGRIEDLDAGPLNVAEIDAAVTFKGERKVTALDEHGYASRSTPPRRASGRLALPRTSIYTLVEK